MKIGLLGHGVIGSGVRKIVDDKATWEVADMEVKRILVKDESEITDPRMTVNVDDILNDPEITAVVECMGGLEPAHTYVKKALEKGMDVVTSNKKMLAGYCGELFDIARKYDSAVHYEASAGGGIPWMASLDRVRRVDDIDSFRGIFNGTTNYILDRMKREGCAFDEMLKRAQELGYAERDPSEDINGDDVRYKVALSCVKAFDALVDASEIPALGIRNITAEDIAMASEMECTIKLIGQAADFGETIQASVIPTFISDEDVFSNVPMNFNAIESTSKTLGPAMFCGQGAGSLPTAHAVVQNLVDIAKKQDWEINSKSVKHIDNAGRTGVFYIRTSRPEVFAEVLECAKSENILITKEISLSHLLKLIAETGDDQLFAAEV